MQERLTVTAYQDDGETLELAGTASSKRGSREIRLQVRRYLGPLGFHPGCSVQVEEHELHRLARTRGTVELAQGVTAQEAHELAWWAAGQVLHGGSPLAQETVWNFSLGQRLLPRA